MKLTELPQDLQSLIQYTWRMDSEDGNPPEAIDELVQRYAPELADTALAAAAGNPEALINWYNDGADGQINWGQPGDFEQCVALAAKHMPEDQADGFCNLRHNDATGEYPATHAKEDRASASTSSLSLYEQIAAKRRSRVDPEKLALWENKLNEFYNSAHDERGRFAETEGTAAGATVGQRLASAKPSGVKEAKAYRAGLGPKMSIDLISDPAKVVARQALVPGFEDLASPKWANDPKAAMEEIVNRQTENITDYAESVVDANPQVAAAYADWYPFAHQYLGDLAEKNGVSKEGAIAAAATLSSSAAWESNVPWAKYFIENLGEGNGPSSETGKYQTVKKEWVSAQYTAALASWQAKKDQLDAQGKEYKTPQPDPAKSLGLVGKQIKDLSDAEVAVALRGKHEASGTGNGAEGKLVTQLGDEVHAGFGTKGAGTIPQSTANLVKAISVLRDPSPENIDKQIGNQNKVRSFYQNLRDPRDKEYEDVTADTHHFGVANGLPWTMSSEFVGGGEHASKDVVSTPGNSKTGALGTYPLVVEATRRATDNINRRYGTDYTPNQIQSIVWEHHKNYYPPKLRGNQELQTSVAAARTKYAAAVAAGQSKASAKLERQSAIDAARSKASTNKNQAPTVKELEARYKRGEL